MRSYITIVGLGQRKSGVSQKTNKPYDFQPVSFTYDDPNTVGQKAATSNIAGPDIDALGGLKIGQQYDAVYHNYNNAVIVDALLA